jgi:hypothetical protein
MPIKFSDLAKATKSATIEVGEEGDTITFRFRHGLITPRFVQDLLALDEGRLKGATAGEAAAAVQAVSEQLAHVVAEWDVTEADGATMFPLDPARLAAEIPLDVQVQMLFTILSEMRPGEVTAPGSNGANIATTSKPSGATS